MITKGVILDCAEKHELGIFEVPSTDEEFNFFSFYTNTIYLQDGKIANKRNLIALRDFLNEILEKE